MTSLCAGKLVYIFQITDIAQGMPHHLQFEKLRYFSLYFVIYCGKFSARGAGVKVSNGSWVKRMPLRFTRVGRIPICFTLGSDGSPWVKWMLFSVVTGCRLMTESAWLCQFDDRNPICFSLGSDRSPKVKGMTFIFCHQMLVGWWQKVLGYFSLMAEIPQLFK